MSLQEDPYDGETPVTHRPTVKRKQKTAEREQEDRRTTLREILRIRPGRELFWWFLEQFGPNRSPVFRPQAGAPIDVNQTLTNVGMQNAGNILLAEITAAAPEQYIEMLKEAQEKLNG